MSEQQSQMQETQETQETGKKHYRMWLNNFVNNQKLGKVEYQDELQGQTWVSSAQLNGTTIGQGEGTNKKAARENAASKALNYLQSEQSA